MVSCDFCFLAHSPIIICISRLLMGTHSSSNLLCPTNKNTHWCTNKFWYRGKEFTLKLWHFCFYSACTSLNLNVSSFLFLPLSPISLYFLLSLPPDSIKFKTRRTQWRRMASVPWPTEWFRSRSTLSTQISLWRLANHHLGLLKAKQRERERERDEDDNWFQLRQGEKLSFRRV